MTIDNNTYFIPENKTTKLLAFQTCKKFSAEVADQNELSSIIQAWTNPLCFKKHFLLITTYNTKSNDFVLALFHLVTKKIILLTKEQKVYPEHHVVCRLKNDITKTTSNKTVLVVIMLCFFLGIFFLVICISFKVSKIYT